VEVLAAEGVNDARVLEAFRRVPRASFVSPDLAHRAYFDLPLPIPHDQVTTQPSLVAKMLQALELRGTEKVLEVGTGHGFQTALLAYLASSVASIECWSDIAESARENLDREEIRNVEVVIGDGTQGLPERAPFGGIVVSAAFPSVAQPLVDQLTEGGRIVQPIGPGGAEDVALFIRRRDGLTRLGSITGARFVRLYGKHGFRR
jgi:protein-L-isoaspartate(D-aspartate) O-methyltransferase